MMRIKEKKQTVGLVASQVGQRHKALEDLRQVGGNIGKFSTINELIFAATDTSHNANDTVQASSYLNAAYNINQGIVPQLVVESNKQAINAIYIDKIVRYNYNLTQAEKHTVDTIAAKCPYSNGPAVIEARAIRMHWSLPAFYNNEDICLNSLPKQLKNMAYVQNNEMFIYPNPSKSSITLKSDIDGTVVISDITGRTLMETVIGIPLTNIIVKDLEPGIYSVTLYSGENLIKSYPLIKIQ